MLFNLNYNLNVFCKSYHVLAIAFDHETWPYVNHIIDGQSGTMGRMARYGMDHRHNEPNQFAVVVEYSQFAIASPKCYFTTFIIYPRLTNITIEKLGDLS